MAAASGEGPITAINVTPLVDIILVVLIIFMATAPMLHKRAIKVAVPRAAHHERAATEALQIIYDGKKKISLSGRTMSLEELSSRLSLAAASQPHIHVTLSADKALAYGEIVSLLDSIRASGVRKIGLEVARR
jgi:biopolymer transport protein ExbD